MRDSFDSFGRRRHLVRIREFPRTRGSDWKKKVKVWLVSVDDGCDGSWLVWLWSLRCERITEAFIEIHETTQSKEKQKEKSIRSRSFPLGFRLSFVAAVFGSLRRATRRRRIHHARSG